MATEKSTTDLILRRVGSQHERLFDLQALICGALAMCDPDDANLVCRLLMQAEVVVADIATELDSAVLAAPAARPLELRAG